MAKQTVRSGNQAQDQPQQHQLISAQWQGPLPPPDALRAFNDVIPNGAERIMIMCESEQSHRVAYEKAQLTALITDTRRGHWLGATICLISIAASVYTAFIRAHWAVSAALVGVPILGIIKSIVENKTVGRSPE